MTAGLQFCRNQKIDGEGGSLSRHAVHLDRPVMRLDDRLCQRQTQAGSLDVRGKAAAVKPFEDIRKILRMDAASVIAYRHLDDGAKPTPGNADLGPSPVWSKAFFTRLPRASVSQPRSQDSISPSDPERTSLPFQGE